MLIKDTSNRLGFFSWKKLWFGGCFFLFVGVLSAQTSEDSRFLSRLAKAYYKRTYFSKAIEVYNRAQKKEERSLSSEHLENLANAYYYTGRYNDAITLYKKLFSNESQTFSEDTYEHYSHCLKTKDLYPEAYALMESRYLKNEDSIGLKKYQNKVFNIEQLRQVNSNRYSITPTPYLNTKQTEFGVVENGDYLVFSASKRQLGFLEREYGWQGEGFLDIYKVRVQHRENGNIVFSSRVEPFSDEINTKQHESNPCFVNRGQTIYFNSNYKIKRNKKQVTNTLTILRAEKEGNNWVNKTPLKLGSSKYSYEHPSVDERRGLLFFSSDMPGGYGSFDLYYIDLNDKHARPVNLGPTINTPKKEQFPFILDNDILYFSSDGHPGYGGLDLFASFMLDKKIFSKPINLASPMNTAFDDFGMYLNSETKKGYFASNRPGGIGKDDIYGVTELVPISSFYECKTPLTGRVLDRISKREITDVKITLKDIEGKSVDSVIYKGKYYKFNAICNKQYSLVAEKEDYRTVMIDSLKTSSVHQRIGATYHLYMVSNEYSQKLSEEKEKREIEQYAKEKSLLATTLKQNVKTRLENDRKEILKNPKILKDIDKLRIDIEDIYFDFDRWYLRKTTRKTLDNVVDIVNLYPFLDLEIAVHSDNRGDSQYNLSLSNKRANSIREYLLQKGVEPFRVEAIGYGETRPLIDCLKQNCGEEEYEINRRSEFIIKDF